MPTWVALLRGINVSGQKPVPMQRLREVFEGLKCLDVKTHVQSGNVVFRRVADGLPVQKIEKAIEEEFGFPVTVILRTEKEWRAVAKANPFKEKTAEASALYVTFLVEKPGAAVLKSLMPPAASPDQFCVHGREIYLHCPGGYGKTKLSNTFFERKLSVSATTRNWKTITALTALLHA